MTKIENWFEINCLEKERKNLTDLYLSRNDLEGVLSLKWEEFPKLERVWYHYELKIVDNYNLTIARLLKKKIKGGLFLETESNVQILKYTPIDEVLEKLYPEDKQKEITELDLTQKGLRGTLDLEEFEKLEELTLNMDCPWGRKYANSNYITGLALPTSLKKLTLINNPIEWDLSKLATLTDLEELNIQGDSKYPAQWTGLEELKELENLTKLDISYNPNIKLGLETIKNLEKVAVKGTNYERSLKSFNGDVQAWKIFVHPKEVSKDKDEIVQKINEYLVQSHDYLKFLDEKGYTDRDLASKIELLETRSRELLK